MVVLRVVETVLEFASRLDLTGPSCRRSTRTVSRKARAATRRKEEGERRTSCREDEEEAVGGRVRRAVRAAAVCSADEVALVGRALLVRREAP